MTDFEKIILGKYSFTFPKTLTYKLFSEKGYRGICFLIKELAPRDSDGFGKFEVIDNDYMGYRLIIRTHEQCVDMPFKQETFRFLPETVKVEEV